MALLLVASTGAVALQASPVMAKEAAAPKPSYSKPLIAVAAPFQKALEAAKKRADVVAAQQAVTAANAAYNATTTSAARKAAATQREAAIAALGATLSNEKTQLEAVFAAITVPDDKFLAGNFALQLGGVAQDVVLQRRGLQAMVDSGKSNPADLPKYNYYLGQFAFDQHDYAAARQALLVAISGGYADNSAGVLLAEAFIADNQPDAGLVALKKAIDAQTAAGAAAPENWYRRGLGIAFKNKLLDKAAVFSLGLVAAYPSTDNWAGAISVMRLVGKYELQERLDLLRLMQRTHSFSEATDYAEFIQAADPRRLPAEVLSVIDEGVRSGKLDAKDLFVIEARTNATDRVAADRPTLPGLEKSALAASATGVSAAATADALLSYGAPDKAEALYALALQRGGVDAERVRTRIGIAQLDQGKFADAKASFDKVTGLRQPLAQLWSIYAGQKAAGK
jgi:hypothetical protein